MNIDWSKTTFFKKHEWPSGTTEQMDPKLFDELFRLRELVPAQCSMIPSPLYAAHVRPDGNSRHSTQRGTRLADATDLFASWSNIWTIWSQALQMGFGGIGLYVDTQYGNRQMPMLHLDMRPERLMWVRHSKDQYVYFHTDPVGFFNVLAKHGLAK